MKIKTGGSKMLWIILLSITALIIGVFIFFNIPYSKTKTEFNQLATTEINKANKISETYTLEDIKDFPSPVQKYFQYCGWLGQPKMAYAKADFKNADFVLNDKNIKIDHTVYGFTNKPSRVAFVDTKMYGLPVQAVDSYIGEVGRMKIVLGKTMTIANEVGPEMDKACLATILSECLIFPNIALQDYITWTAVDDTHAEATITHDGVTASGLFTFSEKGEMIAFTTNDRAYTGTDGTIKQAGWSALLNNYQATNGIKHPSHLKAVWHFDEGDLVYFDSDNALFEYY